ncbi:unnamed protein product [Cochlearia groenlandica]
MTIFNQPCLYSKIDKEDPQELLHRRAKFLIYKTLQEVDFIAKRRRSPSSSSSFLRLKLFQSKVKIGDFMTKLRKSLISAVRFGGIRKRSQSGVRALKKLFHGGATTHRPIFTLEV